MTTIYEVGTVVIARRHFIDTLDRRHLAGTVVGVVTWANENDDAVLIDDVANVREASKWLAPQS